MRDILRLLPVLVVTSLAVTGCGDEAPLPPPPDLAHGDMSAVVQDLTTNSIDEIWAGVSSGPEAIARAAGPTPDIR